MQSEEKRGATVRQKRQTDVSPTATRGAGKAAAGLRNLAATLFLVHFILVLDVTGASSQVLACRPFLSTKAVQAVRPVSLQPLPWRWHATIVADSTFCATRSGPFEIDFIRLKENAPDLQFTQAFRWTQNQFDISMELSPDETIPDFRIGFIAPCVCREVGELSTEPLEK